MRTLTIEDRTQRQILAEAFIANYMLSHLLEVETVLKKFEGKKTVLTNGYWSKAFDTAITPLKGIGRDKSHTEHFDARRHREGLTKSYNSIYYECEIWVTWATGGEMRSDDGGYYKLQTYVGELQPDGSIQATDILKNIEYMRAVRAINWDEVKASQEAIKELKQKIDDLQKTMPYYSYR